MPSAAKVQNLFAFLGSDEARVKEAALALAEKLATPGDEFGMETISGQADHSDHAVQIVKDTLQALQTLPFFGGEKVVWLQSANFFGDTVTGRSQTTLDAVEGLTDFIEAGVPADVKFIISATDIDKRRSFYKKLKKQIDPEVFDKVDISREGWEDQVKGPVSAQAKEMGLRFQPDALERFVLRAGADTRQWQNELEKLAIFLGDRKEATLDDVRTVVAQTHAGIVWEIGDALARRNLPLALELIDQHLNRGDNAIGLLLAGIVPKVRQLLYIQEFAERHHIRPTASYGAYQAALSRLPARETAHISRTKEGKISCYPLFMTAQKCGRFTVADLKEALLDCLDANLRLISTQLDPRVVLSQLVTRILTRQPVSVKQAA